MSLLSKKKASKGKPKDSSHIKSFSDAYAPLLPHMADGGLALGGPSALTPDQQKAGAALDQIMGSWQASGLATGPGTRTINGVPVSSMQSQQQGTNVNQLNNAYDATQGALAQQQALVNQLNAQNGMANQQSAVAGLQGQQQAYRDLATQQAATAAGQGPNPAQAMLAQQTGANVANQAALMAGQRGAGANVGLLARQAAMQGANTQQQAAGQGATLQAQQSLAAQNAQLGTLQALGQNYGQIAGIGGQQTGNQIGAIGNLGGQHLAEQQALLGSNQGANALANQANIAAADRKQAADQAETNRWFQLAGGALNAGGAAAGALLSEGGVVGGGPSSMIGKHLKGSMPMMSQGGKVPAMVSPGEIYLKPEQAMAVAAGKADPKALGEMIKGKAKIKGDSQKNDIVPKNLDKGGVVIKRTVAQSGDHHKMIDFVAQALGHKPKKKAK